MNEIDNFVKSVVGFGLDIFNIVSPNFCKLC